jgi:hypothetical protein
MVTGPVTKVWSVGMCGIRMAFDGMTGIRWTRGMSRCPSTGRAVNRFSAVSWRDTQVVVFAAILPFGLGLLFNQLRRPQLRVILNRTAHLPRSRRPIAGLALKRRSLLGAHARCPANNDNEHQCRYCPELKSNCFWQYQLGPGMPG